MSTKAKRGLITVLLVMLVATAAPPPAKANHRKGTFPTYGLLWTSGRKNYSGLQYVSTNNCNQSQRDAMAAVKSGTTGTSWMGRWANGIQMSEYLCDGTSNNYVDLWIRYKPQSYFLQPNGTYIGGRNVDAAASPSFCSFWNTTHPCGMRPTVEINQDKYAANSSTYKKRLIMHETGHSQGLNHHCTSDSIMNDGSSTCNGGKFTSLSPMTYYATDREGVSKTYP